MDCGLLGSVFRYDDGVVSELLGVYGSGLCRFLEAVHRPSRRLYIRVNTLRVDPSELLDRLRSRGLEVYRDELFDEALYFVVEGPFRIDEEGPVVVADKEAAESVMMGANLYAPGLLSCDPSIRRGSEVVIKAPSGVVVARGIARMSCSEARRRGRGLFVEVLQSLYRAPKLRELPEYQQGLFYPQSLPAIATTRVLDPAPGEVVVDMCAAPGGKTGHVVELSRGLAKVVAVDHSRRKVRRLREELARLGHLRYVEVVEGDSRYIHLDMPGLRADKVLVDPPCTALGVRPKVYDEKTWRDLVNAAAYQEQFVRAAAKILKRGGVLVYSTCTVTHVENELLIERAALGECLEPVDTGLPRPWSQGSTGSYRGMYTRFHPHIHDTPGYFIARLVKKC